MCTIVAILKKLDRSNDSENVPRQGVRSQMAFHLVLRGRPVIITRQFISFLLYIGVPAILCHLKKVTKILARREEIKTGVD
jgi:hypothetical protein